MFTQSPLRSDKGFTLVELMIVVAIIGVLASLAAMGYSRYMTTAKVSNLEALAQEVAVGQNDPLRSGYYPSGETLTYVGATASAVDKKRLKTFLNVNTNNIPQDVTLNICAGTPTDTCSGACCNGITFDTTQGPWYVIRAEQDLDGDSNTESTAVIKTSANKYTVTINQGQ